MGDGGLVNEARAYLSCASAASWGHLGLQQYLSGEPPLYNSEQYGMLRVFSEFFSMPLNAYNCTLQSCLARIAIRILLCLLLILFPTGTSFLILPPPPNQSHADRNGNEKPPG